jgi:hypothetical protein
MDISGFWNEEAFEPQVRVVRAMLKHGRYELV